MKRILAILLSSLICLTVFSGCDKSVLDFIKDTAHVSSIESTTTIEQSTVYTTKSNITKSDTSKSTTAKPVQTTRHKTTIPTTKKPVQTTAKQGIRKDGSYTSKADVALYIHTYGKLPKNFITKEEARALGWPGGYLEPYAPGKCIGGDYYGNYEKNPQLASGHKYAECDINTLGAYSRGAERLVYSTDGLIYYTADHYASFTKLYNG